MKLGVVSIKRRPRRMETTGRRIASLLAARSRSISGSDAMAEIDRELMALGVHAYRQGFQQVAIAAE